jgi:hypothetical protein
MRDAGFESDYDAEQSVLVWLKATDQEASAELLEATFTQHFIDADESSFNKTLFHFLLTRLAAARSRAAVPYCLEALAAKPEETSYILRYLGNIEVAPDERDKILELMESPDSIYDYQLYQMLEWFTEREEKLDRLLGLCRLWAYDRNRDIWLRAWAITYVGKFGDQSDLTTLEQSYPEVADEVEKASYVAALAKLERGRRNAFYKRAETDGPLVAAAVGLMKSRS